MNDILDEKDKRLRLVSKDATFPLSKKDLKVMDSTATALCRDNNIPLLVFGIADPENIVRAVKGEHIGTIVK